jgi:hypothetical protein
MHTHQPETPIPRKSTTPASEIGPEPPGRFRAGELRNSSATSPADIERSFARVAALHANAVLAPVPWALVEPEEGVFDLSLVDEMHAAAQRHGLCWVPLWFGTLKNAISCYAPPWVKTDPQRFPRAETTPGRGSWQVSVFHEAIADADARAFATVLRRIRELDPDGTAVPMAQVENEPGILNAARDRCPAAERAFDQPVPEALAQRLAESGEEIEPRLLDAWHRSGGRTDGTWSELFGRDADEIFMAHHIARFVDRVAAAGKAEHAIPMFANAWLSKGPGYQPGQYPSGGPLPWLLDVWRAAAPHLDALAPDIYQDNFRGYCAAYHRRNNPLLIPEARNTPAAAANALYAFGAHGAVLFAPFAIDECADDHPLAEAYARLGEIAAPLRAALDAGRATAVLQQEDSGRYEAELAGLRFVARPSQTLSEAGVPGVAVILALDDAGETFLALGRNLIVALEPADGASSAAELLWLEEGAFDNGTWTPHRHLNGDETAHGTGLLFGDRFVCYRFAAHAHG